MEDFSIEIQNIGGGVYRVCTPYEGVCIETKSEHRAKAVAEALQRASHFKIRSSRSGDQ